MFAILYGVECYARAILATVITLQALHLFENARDVSLLFSTVGIIGLAASFTIPTMIRHLSRRWVYTLGALLVLIATLALATATQQGQALGMLLRVYGTACLNITLSLYILQYIRRAELTVSEPRRLQYGAFAWVIGPALGVFLYENFSVYAPFALSATMSLALITVFWILRLGDRPGIVPPSERPRRGPARNIGRYFAQPRLRLAWIIVFVRSWWWVFFFIYMPMYVVQQGQSQVAAAMVISAGNGLLFLAPIAGRYAQRFGVRQVLRAGFAICGLFTFTAGIFFDSAGAVIALMLLATIGMVMLDAVGNVPFLASVRAREREEMTTVFRTYLDVAQLVPPALFALVLSFSSMRTVFMIQGTVMLATIVVLRYLPARLGRTRIVIKAENPLPGPVKPAVSTL